MLRRRIFLALLGAMPVPLLAACSEDDTLSRKQYAWRLGAMCESFEAREQEMGEPRTIDDLVEKGPRVLDAFEETIVERSTT